MEAAFDTPAQPGGPEDEIQALAGARELPPRQRAWKLIELARSLRAGGEHERALAALDAALALDESPDPVAAAHMLALAIHRDLGGGERRAGRLLRLRTRLYWELWQRTKSSRFRVCWRRAADAVTAAERS